MVFVLRALLAAALFAGPLSSAFKLTSRRDLLSGDVELMSKEEQPDILVPKHMEPADLTTVVSRENELTLDPEIFLIGLPPKLTEMFQEYLQEVGLMDIFHKLLYEDPVQNGENRVYKLQDGTNFAASRPSNWVHEGDMTWIDPADEFTYETLLDIYRRADFDKVLDTLGEKFGSDGLWLDGTSFIIVSNFYGENMHDDLPNIHTKVFNIIYPIVIPKSAPSQLLVSDRDVSEELAINFVPNVGVLVGGDSKHGTGICNYREAKEFRLAIAVYLDDINEENIDEFAGDTTAFFPPYGDKKWITAQAGRHWGGTNSLKTDKGRDPYNVQDDDDDGYACPAMVEEGKCETDMDIRNSCLKSCKVYMEDEAYYEMLGKLLHWPTEVKPTQGPEEQ